MVVYSQKYRLSIVFSASGAIHLSLLLISKSWMLIKGKLLRNYFEAQEESSWKSHDHLRKRVGLEENINLPATGMCTKKYIVMTIL